VAGAILFFVLFSFQLGSCVDVDDTFGTEYIPAGQIMRILRDSSLRINTYNVTTDSVVSSGMTTNYIGGFHDPLTGSAVDAGLIFQIHRAVFANDSLFGTAPVADSAFLTFAIADQLGKPEVAQTFDLYELTEPVYPDSTYYNDFDPAPITASTPLLSFTISGDEEKVVCDLSGHPLLVRLMDTTGYTSNTRFRERFKGFYLKPRTAMQDASLRLVDLASSSLLIYYRHLDEGVDTMSSTMVASYPVYPASTNSNQSISIVSHDFSLVKPEVRLNDLTVPVPVTYMQGFGGIKTYFEFTKESVDALKAKAVAAGFSGIAVNKAKLQVSFPTRDPEVLDRLYGRLGMFYDYDALRYIPDFNYANEALYETALPYGGYVNRSRFLYEMDITTYVQRLFRENYDQNKVYLTPAVGIAPYAQALASYALNGSASATPPLLVITYTMIR
jgi:hypothetical protein